MSATLTQIAEEYGITKVTARNRFERLGIWDGHAVKQGRAFEIDDYAVEEFAKNFKKGEARRGRPAGSKNLPSAQPVVDASANEELVAELRATIEFLKQQLAQKDDICSQQLAVKDEQIARRDEQISKLIAGEH